MNIKKYRWSICSLIKLAIPLTLLGFLTGCKSTLECGSWTFTGTPQSGDGTDSFPLSSDFVFTPATCGQTCQCDTDCMIQIVSVYDATDRTYLYAGSGDEGRASSYGWTVDRVDGEGYGYYGLINDGSTFDTSWNTTGSNGSDNTLIDDPQNWGPNTWFYALDAAVCFKSTTCQDSILGYYFWSWIIDQNGKATELVTAPAWKDLDTQFQDCILSWNTWAPKSGTESGTSGLPNEPSMTHAAVFPTLSDL